MKKAVIIPDSFKGTFTSAEVCETVRESLERRYQDIECVLIPAADGGEGTADAFLRALGGQRINVLTTDPIGRNIEAHYALINGRTAVIEMAQASGLTLLERPEPMSSTTFGTGKMIIDALGIGVRDIIIAIGGSATTDGGTGCLTALGGAFLTSGGEKVTTGGELDKIADIDLSGLDERLTKCNITVLCDVTNPLFSKNGAAYVFAPQKGADKEQVELLDKGLRNLAAVTERKLGKTTADIPGAGAAGGLGFALMTYLKAEFRSGIDSFLDLCGFSEKIKGADIIITGEGKMDQQSLCGKVPFGVAKRAGGVPVTAIVGVCDIGEDEARRRGIDRIIETNPERLPFSEVKKHCREQLRAAADKITL